MPKAVKGLNNKECKVIHFVSIPVTTIGKRCDDKSSTVAKILVTIHDGGCDHAHCDHTLFVVIPKLRDPLEVVVVVNAVLRHLLHNVTGWLVLIKNLNKENDDEWVNTQCVESLLSLEPYHLFEPLGESL